MNPGDERTEEAKITAKRGEKIIFVEDLVSSEKLKNILQLKIHFRLFKNLLRHFAFPTFHTFIKC